MENSRRPTEDFYDWHQVPVPPKVPCPLCGLWFPEGDTLISHVEDCILSAEQRLGQSQSQRPAVPSDPGLNDQRRIEEERQRKEREDQRRRLEAENEKLLRKMLQDEKGAAIDEKNPEYDDEKGLDPYIIQRRKEEAENDRLLQKFLAEEKERERQQREKETGSSDFQCAICRKNFPFGHENALFLDECSHYHCKPCLKAFVTPLIHSKNISTIRCQVVDCRRPLTPSDLSQCLPKADYDKYLDATFASAVQGSNQFVTCANPDCHNIIERIAAAERSNLTVSAEIKFVKEQYRFRCGACQTEFCSNCHESPYHEGYTCQQFKEMKTKKKCRFCHGPVSSPDKDVCNSKDCLDRRAFSCEKKLPCGHMCSGVKGEKECLPCLHEECAETAHLRQKGDDFCNICWVESLDSAPSLQLRCGHFFHFQCVRKQLEGKWNSAHIAFNFMDCPLCSTPIQHELLHATLDPLNSLRTDIQNKALQRLKFLNLEGVKEIASETHGPFYQKPMAYAMKRFCYYLCFKCQKPYFGGERSCNAEQRAEDYDPKELVCGTCSGAGKGTECPIHKNDFIAWKCKFCCNVAAWFCWGNTHFCDTCHKNHATITKVPKEKLSKCSCKIPHPPNGEEYCIGCSLCQIEPKDF